MWLAALMMLGVADAAPRGYAGLAYKPLSRQDLVWVEQDRTSDVLVGEFDGAVRGNLEAFGGVWFNRFVGLNLTLGVAQWLNESVVNDVTSRKSWLVVRPGLDVRLGWIEPKINFPVPWFFAGVHGDIPAVRDRSNGYTPEEQEAASDAATVAGYRLGGVGGKVGAGVDYRILPGFLIGATFGVGIHRGTYVGADSRYGTLWVQTEASLLLAFEWGGRPGSEEK